MEKQLTIPELKQEIIKQISNKETLQTLTVLTFKGLNPSLIQRVLLEGMMNGFSFQDFLRKDVYAIPFKDNYSLVASIDYTRKIGMRSGVVGVSEPMYEEKDGKIISCLITVKKKIVNTIGDFTAKVYFNEYNTGRNLWVSKPRTMIAKVAEMHALRKACPEELSQLYVEEEYQKEKQIDIDKEENKEKEKESWVDKLIKSKDIEELKNMWVEAPAEIKKDLEKVKEDLKIKLTKPQIIEGEVIK